MKFRKLLKRFFLILLILIVLLVGTLFAIPFFFKDQLLTTIKQTVNSSIHGNFDFEDANMSLFRSFPDVSVRVDRYSLTGKAPFEGQELVAGEAVDVTVDLWSLIYSDRPIEVKKIGLEAPRIYINVLKNGLANYDIALPDTTTATDTAAAPIEFELSLKDYSIENGQFIYKDDNLNTDLEILGLQHRGSARLQTNVYELSTETSIEALSITYGGIQYLSKTKTALDADILADLGQMRFTLSDNTLLLNELKLLLSGFVQVNDPDKITMDLSFEAPGNDFRELLSMVPNAFIEGYEEVKVSGNFQLKGSVKGDYVGENYPAIAVNMSVNDGAFQYPDLPLGISGIQTQLAVQKPQGDLDKLSLQLDPFALQLGSAPITGSFQLKTPISDPDIATSIKGKLNLEDLAKAFPIEGVSRMAGLINADVQIQTRLSTIERAAYEQVNMSGALSVSNIIYQAQGLPNVQIPQAQATFSPQRVDIPNFTAKLGKSDLSGSGSIDNILAYISPQKTMKGQFKIRSTYFNADEWMTTSEESNGANTASTAEPQETTTELFNRFEIAFDGKIDQLDYDVYPLKNIAAKGLFTPAQLRLDHAALQLGASDFQANGTIDHVWDYVFEEGTLGGEIDLNSRLIDLNNLMEISAGPTETSAATTTTTTASYDPIPIPANIDLGIDAKIGEVRYGELILKNLVGRLDILEEALILEKTTAQGLNGTINVSGSYDTSDKENPSFNLKYDLERLSFKESFQAFNTFESFAPIGKYINGTFNNSMIMSGVLGKDMMPKLESISAEGFLETINGVVRNFKPLKAVGEQFNVSYFDDIQLTNTKNWFEINNGKVTLQPFTTKVQDINLDIQGSHGLNQEMDYEMLATVPRKVVENSPAGSLFNQGSDWLQQQANKLGTNIEKAENFIFQINMTGNLQDPKVKVQLVGTEGTSLKETVTESAKETIQEEKEKLQQEAQEKLDDAKAQAQAELDKAKQKLDEEAQKKKEEAAQAAKDKLEETLGKKTDEEVDKIKEKLEDFNPFKKKPKKDGN